MMHRCTHEPAEVVAGQPLFASLPAAECRALAERSPCRALPRGRQLFREGEPTRGLYLIVEGAVRVYRANAEGQEQVLGLFGPGESLGEASLFDGGPYLASARAQEDSRVLFLPLDEVQALYESRPGVARAVVHDLGTRVRRLVRMIDQLSLQDVPTRVASALLRYARAAGTPGDGVVFRLPRTQAELGAELGMARESVARALRELRDAGVVEQRGAVVRILDVAALRRVARARAEVAA